MSEPRRYSWEDYLYPTGADGVQILRNKPDVHDLSAWVTTERRLTFLRQQELIAQPALVLRTFDTDHWKRIHRHLFQDMYEWAGEFRTVDIGKASHGFVAESQLKEFVSGILDSVREANMFAGRDRGGVVEGLTVTMQALNIIHPFRYLHARDCYPTRT